MRTRYTPPPKGFDIVLPYRPKSYLQDSIYYHNKGRKDYKEGKLANQNPYKKCTDYMTDAGLKYMGWRNGWNYAHFCRNDKP